MICHLYSQPLYLIFSPDSLPELLYYSHISSGLIALLIGAFIFVNGRQFLLNKLLFLITGTFFLWVFANLITWTNVDVELILLMWTIFEILTAILSILCIYFIYVFLNKKDISTKLKLLFILLLSPVLIFAPTVLNLTGFNLLDCDAFDFEKLPYKIYYTSLGVIAMVWIFILLLKHYRIANADFKKQILLMGIGIESFLFFFFTTTFLTSYLTSIEVLDDSRFEMYGLFGMAIFMVVIAVMVVKFNVFRVRLIATQALVVSISLLVGSQLLFIESTSGQIVTGFTFLFSVVAGYLLIKSVKKEIQHREEIEKLVKKLKRTNDRLKILDKQKSEFVSIASHQLRSPLAAISGYASLLQDGNFGKLPAKASESVQRIYSSARAMSQSIEEYLNVSQIESGNMKYNMTDFNLVNLLENICDDLRSVALKKGVLLFFRTDLTRSPIVHADQGKVTQALHNLINNSIKYTEKGTVTAYVHDNLSQKKIFIEILDTGIGMSAETLEIIFQKFERADNAHVASVQGTGLGLYMALKIVEAMGGTINAYSDGEGKGSRFVLELPMI